MIYAIKTDDNKTVATMDYVRNAQVLYDILREYAKDSDTHSAVLYYLGNPLLYCSYYLKDRANLDRTRWKPTFHIVAFNKLQKISASEAKSRLKLLLEVRA